MPLSPDIAEKVLAACRQNAGEIAAGLSRALESPVEIEAERIETFQYTAPAPEWSGPGLVLVFNIGGEAAVALLAASSGLVPPWASAPDAAGQTKLDALAQELGKSLFPLDQ